MTVTISKVNRDLAQKKNGPITTTVMTYEGSRIYPGIARPSSR